METMKLVQRTLETYGATLGEKGQIHRNGAPLPVLVIGRKRRIYFTSVTGRTLASGPAEAATVETFVESFWFWKRYETPHPLRDT